MGIQLGVKQLESSCDDDWDERFGFLDLVAERPVENLGQSDLTFGDLLSSEEALKVQEDGGRSGCGGKLWPAGDLLARFCIRALRDGNKGCLSQELNSALKMNNKVVELGSGTGFVGLALGRVRSDLDIFVTDQANMLPLMQENIALNDLDDTVHARVLDWGQEIDAEMKDSCSLILAADCIYFEPAFPLLEKTLVELLSANANAICLMAYKRRRKADTRFVKHLVKKKHNRLVLDEITSYPEYPSFCKQSVVLYRIKLAP